MEYEKRQKQDPIPNKLEEHLNAEQMLALRQVESFGWSLKFVRRPPFQESVTVITGPGGKPIGVLETDGTITKDPDIIIRD